MENTIYVVIVIVIIIVIALVVLTLFGNSAVQVGSMTDMKNNCLLQARSSCSAGGRLPPTWFSEVDPEEKLSCHDLTNAENCDQI